jgi:hypothetical protein
MPDVDPITTEGSDALMRQQAEEKTEHDKAKARYKFHTLICPTCIKGRGLCLRGRYLASATMPGRKEHRKRESSGNQGGKSATV